MFREAMIVISQSPASPALRRGTFVVLAVTSLASIAITPFAPRFFGDGPGFFGMAMAMAILATAFTAILLGTQANTDRSVPRAVLAIGFGMTSLTLVPFALLFVGVFGALSRSIGSSPSGPSYLYLIWHAWLIAGVVGYHALDVRIGDASPRAQYRRIVGRTFGGALACCAVAIPLVLWGHELPALFDDRTRAFTPLTRFGTLPITALLALAAASLTIVRRRANRILDLGLAFVMVALALDAYLTSVGSRIYSVGWYASRLTEILSTTAILFALVWQSTQMYANLAKVARRFELEANSDRLTGLANRRAFDTALGRLVRQSRERGTPLTLAFADVDFFKSYNDAYGHPAGDACLQQIGETIFESIRTRSDFAARYGGEEFVVLLDDTDVARAAPVLERLREAVEQLAPVASDMRHTTISIGYAALTPGESARSLVERADRALYHAKASGRNRIALPPNANELEALEFDAAREALRASG